MVCIVDWVDEFEQKFVCIQSSISNKKIPIPEYFQSVAHMQMVQAIENIQDDLLAGSAYFGGATEWICKVIHITITLDMVNV